MLIGEYHHNLVNKGRLTLPSKFREELGEDIVITRGFENTLLVYTSKVFEQMAQSINSLPFTKQDSRNFQRFFLSGATAGEFDKQGRINITSILLSYADLTKECVIIGLGDHLEIWSLENWNAFYNSTKDKMSDIAENIYLGDKNETLSGDVK